MERNAVIGAHRRSVANKIKYLARLAAPVDCVAALAKGLALGGALRLAPNAGSLAEQDKINLEEH